MTYYEMMRRMALTYAVIMTVGPLLGISIFIGGVYFS